MKAFLFMNPLKDYFDADIRYHISSVDSKSVGLEDRDYTPREQAENALVYCGILSEQYMQTLNQCIDERYRQQGYGVYFSVYPDTSPDPDVVVRQNDTLLLYDMSFSAHTAKLVDGSNVYPDEDHLLDQLGDVRSVRIAGVHREDCVSRVARMALERGMEVSIDAELDEWFGKQVFSPDFDPAHYVPETYPNSVELQNWVMRDREEPWNIQRYVITKAL